MIHKIYSGSVDVWLGEYSLGTNRAVINITFQIAGWKGLFGCIYIPYFRAINMPII